MMASTNAQNDPELVPYTVETLYNMTKQVSETKLAGYVKTYYHLILNAVKRGKYNVVLKYISFDDVGDQMMFASKAIEKIQELFSGIKIHPQSSETPKFLASWDIEQKYESIVEVAEEIEHGRFIENIAFDFDFETNE